MQNISSQIMFVAWIQVPLLMETVGAIVIARQPSGHISWTWAVGLHCKHGWFVRAALLCTHSLALSLGDNTPLVLMFVVHFTVPVD